MLRVAGPETVSMTTRDGVRLDADLYRPADGGPYPVLLMRQPYGRRIASTVVFAHPRWYAAQGYIIAIQDVRGTGSSEGTFRAFETEREDGADAVAWAAAAGLDGPRWHVWLLVSGHDATAGARGWGAGAPSTSTGRAGAGHGRLGHLWRLGL